MLQEALVAMFKWYQGSAMAIVFLRGVCSPSQHGALVRSIWNTRAWTLQEYVAAKVVRFYTEDWTTLASTGRRAVDYRRVAADSMITVRFQENVSLADLLDNVRTIDVL